MFKFNNLDLPSYVKVKKVDIQVLAEVSHFTKKINGSNGLLMGKTTLGAKVIKAPFSIVVPSGKTLQACARELAVWMMGDSWNLSALIMKDEPSMVYMAKINNPAELSDLLFAGQGVFEFIVPSGTVQASAGTEISGTQKAVVNYLGTSAVLPEIDVTFTADISQRTITVTNLKTGVASSFAGAFKAGDKVTISCKNNSIKLNGVLKMNLFTFDNKYIALVNGSQDVSCSIPQCTVKVKYNTCWV